MKTSLKNEFASFQTLSRPFEPAHFVIVICQMQAISSGIEFLQTLSSFKTRRKGNLSPYVRVLQNTSHAEVSGRSRAVDIKEMY